MAEVRVLHTADLHLDWPFASMGSDGKKGRFRREELKDAFVGVIDLAAAQRVDLLLIAGDLFEHAHVTRSTIQFLDQQFRRIPEVRIFVSPGNHDPYLPDSYYRSHPWPEHVTIFTPQGDRCDLEIGGQPVTVAGWGFGGWEEHQSHLSGLAAAGPGRIHLVCLHGGEVPYHPFGPAELGALRADYVALGHIHQGGTVLEQDGRVVARYSGSPEPLGFGEPGEHGVWLGTVGRGLSRMEFLPTARRRYQTVACDLTGAGTVEEVTAAIGGAATGEEAARDCFRILLTGALQAGFSLDLPLLEGRLQDRFWFLRLVDRTGPGWDLDELARERSARGLFVRRLTAMAAGARSPEEQHRIERALMLGLGALAGKGEAR